MSPHDVAWDALQKEEQAEEEEDFRLWDDEGNLHPEYVSCPTCHGLGYRDESNGYPLHGGETCLHCWGHGVVHRTEEENRPIDDLMSDFAANPTPETKQSVNQYFAEEPEMVFPEKFSNLMTGEPMDLTWRLLKSGLSFPTDDDDEDDEEKESNDGFKPFFDEEFIAHMKEFEKNRSEDEQYTNYVLDAGPHWTLDDRQKRVVEAALNIPDAHPNHPWGKSHYMREETHDMSGHFGHLFDHNSHQVPDHEYDRAVAVINNYAKEIDAHMSNPNADMSEEFMDDITSPEHPWTKALEGYDGPLSTGVTNWQTKNASEPMDLAFRLLKTNDPHEDDYVIEEDLHGDSNQALDNRHIYELMGRIRDDGETHNDIRTTMNRGEKGADTRKRGAMLNQNWLAELEQKNQERFRRGSTYPIYRSEPMDIAMRLLKESVQTKLPGYDNPRPAATIRRHHERREGG